jgi:hypothetical protein
MRQDGRGGAVGFGDPEDDHCRRQYVTRTLSRTAWTDPTARQPAARPASEGRRDRHDTTVEDPLAVRQILTAHRAAEPLAPGPPAGASAIAP